MARILIADDRESMRMAVKTVIRMHPGWEVCGEADDGREAVTKALELRPDLFFWISGCPSQMASKQALRFVAPCLGLRL
jgi:two-component system, NarL family, response regulator NreC